jgi:hypothetical protein
MQNSEFRIQNPESGRQKPESRGARMTRLSLLNSGFSILDSIKTDYLI